MSAGTELTTEIDAHVARICNLGCREVYLAIEALASGRDNAATATLPVALRQAVLIELKAVMAIYDARDGGPSCRTG